ncbi:Sperm-Specific family, class S [Caenorhabditis elegans]|uniref:Sperm-Specific family, class S n=1 Tax=Caenorhabditis elegans TaxID=6239 RepID=Q9XVP7_CAEEL|nr:Sperm-Specific family, class S [Caenorhabditis elegans]CAB03036.1 Sperm-Specific family, class S [Caenorhabditis elegans]|eukprot:NP_501780.1 Sperm-Specific family, class S [Caenorhabditis elegans]
MVKKITVYTAFGQFLEMIERQAEQRRETVPVICPIVEKAQPRTALNKVQSCPVVPTTARVTAEIKKSISCPLLALQADQLIEVTVSPVPTTTESKKINEAAELMANFWMSFNCLDNEKEQMESIFEKMNGLFAAPSTTSTASLFGKYEGFFEKTEVATEDMNTFLWNSPAHPSFPQLPVFVKSPIDSMKIYGAVNHKFDISEDESLPCTAQSVSSPISPSSTTSDSSSETIILGPGHLLQEVYLQRMVIEEQKKIIDSFHEIQKLNKKLAALQNNFTA